MSQNDFGNCEGMKLDLVDLVEENQVQVEERFPDPVVIERCVKEPEIYDERCHVRAIIPSVPETSRFTTVCYPKVFLTEGSKPTRYLSFHSCDVVLFIFLLLSFCFFSRRLFPSRTNV